MNTRHYIKELAKLTDILGILFYKINKNNEETRQANYGGTLKIYASRSVQLVKTSRGLA